MGTAKEAGRTASLLMEIPGQARNDEAGSANDNYTVPCSSIAWATFMKPAMLAPFT